MRPYLWKPDDGKVRGENFFWEAAQGYRDNDPLYLLPGQSDWLGPIPADLEDGRWLRYLREGADQAAKYAANEGIYFLVQTVGEYIRTHRLRTGPAKKLSDWKQLPANTPLLINPCSTPDDFEKALSRAKYLQRKGLGCFRVWTDEGSALWVERL